MVPMMKLIQVLLDGSDFAEQALPMALGIAQRDHAELELVHVYEWLPPYHVSGASPFDPALDIQLRKDRASYLEAIADRVRKGTDIPVRSTVLDGPVRETLAKHIAELGADLVVMTTHGRGGLSRAWLGSVASDLVRHSSAPLLLLRPTPSGSRSQPAQPFAHVLIPLDGSPAGEEAIEHALTVAGDQGVQYLLLHVLEPIFYIGDPASFAYPDEVVLEQAAEAYLGGVADRIRARGFAVETRVLRYPQAARAILKCVEENPVDLIAMETHGRSGAARLLMGSVADKVVRSSPVPVLLHRPRLQDA